jgi:hypothetical protein
VREKVVVGQLRVIQVPSARQYADIMTKGLPSAIFDEFRSSLCIRFGHAATAGGGGGVERQALGLTIGTRLPNCLPGLQDLHVLLEYSYSVRHDRPWASVYMYTNSCSKTRACPAFDYLQ